MSVEFLWQLPTSGDGRYGDAPARRRGERRSAAHPWSPGVTDPRGTTFNLFDHLHQVARAAELAGFDGLRIPEDPRGDEPWIVAGYLARGTRRLTLLAEFEASRGSAVYAAKNAVTLQRYTGGRFAWQLGLGGDVRSRRALADFLPEGERLQRVREFVTVARGVATHAPFSFKGHHFAVRDGGFRGPLGGQQLPPIYLSGQDEEALRLTAQVGDVHVFEATSPAVLQAEADRLQQEAASQGRTVRTGLRLEVLARETAREATRDARRAWEQLAVSEGLPPPSVEGPLWVGRSGHRAGASATLVGSYTQVVEALVDYARAGVDRFLLSGVPHLEEAYRVGEQVLPLVRAQLHGGRRRTA